MKKQNISETEIEKAFFELLETEPFEKITVKELLEKSGIPKTTFYRHYKDLFDIFDKVISRDLASIEGLVTENNIDEKIDEMVDFLYSKRNIIHNIVFSDFDNTFSRNILYFFHTLSKKYVSIKDKTSSLDDHQQAFAEQLAFELFGRFVNWILSGMTTKPVTPFNRL